MFRYINLFILSISFIISSCGDDIVLDQRISSQAQIQLSVLCDTSIYGTDCENLDDFVLIKKDEIKAENIVEGSSIAGVSGTYLPGSTYEECDEDNKIGCITTNKYRAINIDPYLSSISSEVSILDKQGSLNSCEAGDSSCYLNSNSLKAVESSKLIASNIKHGVSIGDIVGDYEGDYSECSVDGSTECITTTTYKAININNHVSKIISSESIFGVSGTYVVPPAGTILQSASYGVAGALLGTMPYCSETGSGCYLKTYAQGVSGYTLKALDYDDLYSKRSYIKNEFTLAPGITGTQSLCAAGGVDCYINGNTFKAVESSNLIASNIKAGVSLGGVPGSYSGAYSTCSEDGSYDCVVSGDYKAIDMNNHRDKIISSENIFGVSGTYNVPDVSYVLSTTSYGVDGALTGTVSDCSSGESGCYLQSYSQGESPLQALNYDDLYSSRSYIKNGYELVDGITGTQSICSAGSNSCYINSNSLKAAEISKLVASNIKHDVVIGGVTGSYSGDYSSCSSSVHTGCIAGESYPSVPTGITSSLLSSASVNGTPGSIGDCSVGGSSCYINGNTFKAAESDRLIPANINLGVSLGLVGGAYNGEYSSCSSSVHTSCIADSSYPSVPAGITSSLLSSVSVNGTPGSIGMCSSGDSECYINGGDLLAAESSSLIAANIKKDVVIGGVTGAYPSSSYPLVEDTVTQDLTGSNFNSLIVNDASFEWFDGFGNRHSATGDSDLVAANLRNGVEVFGVVGEYGDPVPVTSKGVGHYGAIALKKKDGTVVCFGESNYGGDCSGVVGLENVVDIFSTAAWTTGVGAFAALKSDGSVVTWGDSSGGGNSSSAVGGTLSSGVVSIYSNEYAFAALKEDGSVVYWGSSNIEESEPVGGALSSGVVNIFSTRGSFAALKSDGSVVTWGNGDGGDFTVSSAYRTAAPEGSLSSGVTSIYSTGKGGAFAALKSDGSVVTWGNSSSGGNSSSPVGGTLSSGVVSIFSTNGAFAALKSDGSVVTWGNASYGGDSSSPVGGSLSSGVVSISSTDQAFAALKSDGSVVTWGYSGYGGNGSSAIGGTLSSGVVSIFSTESAFAALKSDGSVVTWGNEDLGGDPSYILTYTESSTLSDITNIFSNEYCFMAVREDDSYVLWGAYYD